MKTQLFYKPTNTIIEGSCQEKLCFVKNSGTPTEKTWNIYIRDSAKPTMQTMVSITQVVKDMLGKLIGHLGDATIYLLPMLTCKETEIHAQLDGLYIRQDQLAVELTEQQSDPLAVTGEVIQPPDLIRLCKDSSYVYAAGEYIGYALQGDSTYKYGKVINQISDDLYNVELSPGDSKELDANMMRYFDGTAK